MSEELVKGNEIIKKLQGEIKNYHAKVCKFMFPMSFTFISIGSNFSLIIRQYAIYFNDFKSKIHIVIV